MAKLSVDHCANAAYLRLSSKKIVKTCEVVPGVLVDLDEFNVAVGVEFLSLDVAIPYNDLIQKYHVHSSNVPYLDMIRPSVTYFLSRQQTTSTIEASQSVKV